MVDANKDGQVSLYEWRTAKLDTSYFVFMDLNMDGFVTPEEYFKHISTGATIWDDKGNKILKINREILPYPSNYNGPTWRIYIFELDKNGLLK